MKKYTVYGNCQSRVIPSVLGSSKLFKEKFEYVDVKAVHNMSQSDVEDLANVVLPSIDLFIFQPVSERFKNDKFSTSYLLKQLRSDCTRISFPSSYFRGYNPELVYLKDERNTSITDIYDYHDINVISSFLMSDFKLIEHNVNALKFYGQNFSHNIVEDSLKELERREQDIFGTGEQLDIKLSQFIQHNFRTQRLFYTINHPSTALFRYIGEQMLKFLDIDDQITFFKDPLSHTAYPVYRSHYENLGLEFENPSKYRIKGEEFGIDNMLAKYASYYSTLPREILEKNAINYLIHIESL